MAVAAVICVLVLVVILAVTQIVIQLRLQSILHKLDNGLLERILDVFQLQVLSIFNSSRIFS